MVENLPKAYEPADVEKRWNITWWEGAQDIPSRPGRSGEPFSIVIPRQNVTGAPAYRPRPQPDSHRCALPPRPSDGQKIP